jgi:CheY-like chemotaxis protein
VPVLKILLVEDDDVDVMTARRALAKAGVDHELRIERTGAAGLASLRAAAAATDPFPDLLILDLNLPMLSGLELLAAIKQTPDFGPIPAVILTTSGYEKDVSRSFELGAAGYFVKPVEFEQYVAVIGTMCRYWTPLAASSDPATSPAGEQEPSNRRGGASKRGAGSKPMRILVVEDDSIDMMALQRLAEARELPWELIPAYSLAEAMSCLERQKIDLVLIDQVLPDGAGAQLLGRLGNIPAIIVAGDRGREFRKEVLQRGAVGYVTKNPTRSYLDEIPRAIAAALERLDPES